jgi:predicted lipid-binding transport protein (Tim44 family)
MQSKLIILVTVFLFAAALSGCGGPAANTNVNQPQANVRPDTNNPANTQAQASLNNAPTLTPVFKAYCDAWVKGDEAALRKVYSSDTIKSFEAQMKDEKVKSLMKFLEADKVSGTPCEVANETLTGDKATATIKSNKYPRGLPVEFVKENGEWKLTNRSAAISSMPSNVSNANAAK